MRLMSTMLALAVTVIVGGGCVIVAEGGTEGDRAELTVFYTFEGKILESADDCEDLGIATIKVDVEGVNVNDGISKEKQCGVFYQGMTISDLMVGDYDVMVKGKDSSGIIIFGMPSSREVRVRSGGGEVDVDAEALFGSLTVYWSSFDGVAGSGRCSAAEVEDVRAVLYSPDGSLALDEVFDCTYGGIVWDYLSPGEWEIVLNGLDDDGNTVYAGEAFVLVEAGEKLVYEVDLDMIVGDLTFFWRFDGSTRCGNVEGIQVRLYDPWDYLYDSYFYDCDLGGLTYRGLYAGEWRVVLDGLDGRGRIIYRTDDAGVLMDVEEGLHLEYYVDLF